MFILGSVRAFGSSGAWTGLLAGNGTTSGGAWQYTMFVAGRGGAWTIQISGSMDQNTGDLTENLVVQSASGMSQSVRLTGYSVVTPTAVIGGTSGYDNNHNPVTGHFYQATSNGPMLINWGWVAGTGAITTDTWSLELVDKALWVAAVSNNPEFAPLSALKQ